MIAKQVDSDESLDISKVLPAKPGKSFFKFLHARIKKITISYNENVFVLVEPYDVKSYDILGSYKDFKQQAARERQIQLLSAKSSFVPTNDLNNNIGSETSTSSSEGKNVNFAVFLNIYIDKIN